MSFAAVFQRIVGHLDKCDIEYMIVGSFASTYFGAKRTTADLDIVVDASPDQLLGLVADLQADGYYAEVDAAMYARRHESLFNVIDTATGWKIDLIFRNHAHSIRKNSGGDVRRTSLTFSCSLPARKT